MQRFRLKKKALAVALLVGAGGLLPIGCGSGGPATNDGVVIETDWDQNEADIAANEAQQREEAGRR